MKKFVKFENSEQMEILDVKKYVKLKKLTGIK